MTEDNKESGETRETVEVVEKHSRGGEILEGLDRQWNGLEVMREWRIETWKGASCSGE